MRLTAGCRTAAPMWPSEREGDGMAAPAGPCPAPNLTTVLLDVDGTLLDSNEAHALSRAGVTAREATEDLTGEAEKVARRRGRTVHL